MRFMGNPRVREQEIQKHSGVSAAQQCVKLLPGNNWEAIKESHSFKCLIEFDCDDFFGNTVLF